MSVHAVLRAAGGEMVDMHGAPVRCGSDTVKLPDHIAGSKDVLASLHLLDPKLAQGTHSR